MNPTSSSEDDGAFRKLLGAWKVNTPLPPRFDEQVWKRIDRTGSSASAGLWIVFVAALGRAFARPSQAVAYAAILLMAGSLGGYWQARAGNERTAEDLRVRYVQMMDPYQMPRH